MCDESSYRNNVSLRQTEINPVSHINNAYYSECQHRLMPETLVQNTALLIVTVGPYPGIIGQKDAAK